MGSLKGGGDYTELLAAVLSRRHVGRPSYKKAGAEEGYRGAGWSAKHTSPSFEDIGVLYH